MNIINKIFSFCENDTNTKYIIKIFGIKFTVKKIQYAKKYKNNPFLEYKKNNIDITQVPFATGIYRDVQLAGLYLLKELDYICKQHNIEYWLDFGTLLGAVRHKGYIPWDDDIDVGIMRSDYEKLQQVFDSTKKDDDLYLKYHTDLNHKRTLIKLCHKKSEHIFLDIFPYDYYGKILSEKDQISETIQHKKIREKFIKKLNINDSKEIHEKFAQLRKTFNPDLDKSDVIWGYEFGHSWKKWIHSFDTMFPLTQIAFEEGVFPCPNNYKKYLESVYGDYMRYPKKIPFGHIMYIDFSQEELSVIKKLSQKQFENIV